MATHLEPSSSTPAEPNAPREARARDPLARSGFALGRIFGIELRVDWSLSIIFALIAFDLGAGVFPSWHPEWSLALRWGVALGAAVLFFASVLAHELSHALVARAKGLPVPRITLFIFGGIAELEREPDSPGSEALIAVVGPLMSFAIGFGSLWLVGLLVDPDLIASFEAGDVPEGALSTLGPLATLLLWLGPVNVTLAVFNLVPGFPLDGGRLLRAFLWWTTKDLAKATRWAAYGGQGVAFVLMGLGVINMLRGGFSQGLWLLLIGWLLSYAARMSVQRQVVTQALEGVPVQRVMRTRFERIAPSLSVEALAREMLWNDNDQRAYPVEQEGVLVGLVCLSDLRRVPQERWPDTPVSEVMTPAERLTTLPADAAAQQAADALARSDIDQLPIVRGPKERPELLGLVRRSDILRWVGLLQPAAR